MMRRVVLGITGASGALYGVRMLRILEQAFDTVYLCVSRHGRQVLASELEIGTCPDEELVPALLGHPSPKVELLAPDDYFTPPASGSVMHEGMVIAPCSMGTAGRIASGTSSDLISRAADVCLKERRPLLLIIRETPLNLVHLRNLTCLAEAGAIVMPASPSFYHRPHSAEELVDTVVRRAARLLGILDDGDPEWQVSLR